MRQWIVRVPVKGQGNARGAPRGAGYGLGGTDQRTEIAGHLGLKTFKDIPVKLIL